MRKGFIKVVLNFDTRVIFISIFLKPLHQQVKVLTILLTFAIARLSLIVHKDGLHFPQLPFFFWGGGGTFFMRQLSHYSYRHVNNTFWSLTEDFLNEYGSKFLVTKILLLSGLSVKRILMLEHTLPFGEWCVTEQIKRHVDLTHRQYI